MAMICPHVKQIPEVFDKQMDNLILITNREVQDMDQILDLLTKIKKPALIIIKSIDPSQYEGLLMMRRDGAEIEYRSRLS